MELKMGAWHMGQTLNEYPFPETIRFKLIAFPQKTV